MVIFYLAGLREKENLKVRDLVFPKLQFSFFLQGRSVGGREQFHNPFCFRAPSG